MPNGTSVPITWAYNHHYTAYVLGKHAAMEEVVLSGPLDSRFVPTTHARAAHKGMKQHRPVRRRLGNGSLPLCAKALTSQQACIPAWQDFTSGDGGEFRKSFHGYLAPPCRAVLALPSWRARTRRCLAPTVHPCGSGESGGAVEPWNRGTVAPRAPPPPPLPPWRAARPRALMPSSSCPPRAPCPCNAGTRLATRSSSTRPRRFSLRPCRSTPGTARRAATFPLRSFLGPRCRGPGSQAASGARPPGSTLSFHHAHVTQHRTRPQTPFRPFHPFALGLLQLARS